MRGHHVKFRGRRPGTTPLELAQFARAASPHIFNDAATQVVWRSLPPCGALRPWSAGWPPRACSAPPQSTSSEREAGRVAHDGARTVGLIERPRRREAARRHCLSVQIVRPGKYNNLHPGGPGVRRRRDGVSRTNLSIMLHSDAAFLAHSPVSTRLPSR